MKEEKNILKGFDELINSLDNIADHCEQTMPLANQSLKLSVAIIKTYKKAFNEAKK